MLVDAIAYNGGCRVRIDVPEQIMSRESRMAFRVPVVAPKDVGPHGRVHGTRRTLHLAGHQRAGRRLPRARGAAAALKLGNTVHLTLADGDDTVRLQGEVRRSVRRHDGVEVGLMYLGVLKGGEALPPAALRHIVGRLERRWLRRRADAPRV